MFDQDCSTREAQRDHKHLDPHLFCNILHELIVHPPLFKRIPTYRYHHLRKKKEKTKTNVVSNTISQQPHHMYSTLQRRGNGRFHIVST